MEDKVLFLTSGGRGVVVPVAHVDFAWMMGDSIHIQMKTNAEFYMSCGSQDVARKMLEYISHTLLSWLNAPSDKD